MCCFSGKVEAVQSTRIFARASAGDRQYLVYEMMVHAREDLAMILPVPVPPRAAEDAVRFIALDDFRYFFGALDSAFPYDISRGIAPAASQARARTLEVVEVGDFVASFVPSLPDFDRLDRRFRLSPKVWDALPGYRDFGFAVFTLRAGRREVHPMAFDFPRRDPTRLFFPTVHVHDGKVHGKARFDHVLFRQGPPRDGWQPSRGPAGQFLHSDDHGLVDRDALLYRLELRGKLPNVDTYV
jgi:hypothetical protein